MFLSVLCVLVVENKSLPLRHLVHLVSLRKQKTILENFMKKILLLIVFTTFICPSFAQELDGWKLNGQIQLRTEVDGRDFSNSTHPLTFASLRTRLGIDKTFDKKVQLFVQFQDSRVFGEEPNTLTAVDNIDLHQGYVRLMKLFEWDVNVQAGRFEVVYGTERFFGAVGWHYVGRSFDGVRFTLLPEQWNLDLFALTIKESNQYIGNATPVIYPYPQQPTPATSIYGIWKKTELSKSSKFDLFGYYEIDREDVAEKPDTNKLELFTTGGTYWGNYGDLSTIFEGAYQFGSKSGNDLSAYLISLQLFYKTGITKFGLGGDILSGTDPESTSGDVNVFHASYGTNHKFYGYMDYFINIPNNTYNLGLNDFYASANFSPAGSKFNFDAAFHLFMSNQSVNIITQENPEGSDENMFGQELDLTINYAFTENTNLVWGGSLFFPGELFKTVYAPREDTGYWTYLMITAGL